MATKSKLVLADDTTEQVSHLVWQRLPWLVVGLVGAGVASILVSRFEQQLAQNVSLAFFIPAIVYMADAVGTQTETILVRHLTKKVLQLPRLVAKEFGLGLVLGMIFGSISGVFASFVTRELQVAITVGLAMFVNITIAPLVAVALVYLLQKERTDPALGAGPFTTILQDILSLLIYFAVATMIVF